MFNTCTKQAESSALGLILNNRVFVERFNYRHNRIKNYSQEGINETIVRTKDKIYLDFGLG